jgi:FkbM family methyltransferase
MADIATVVRRFLDGLNIHVSRGPAVNRFPVRLVRACEEFRIDTILDVGANRGQFGLQMRRAGYTGRIVSFEPLADAHARLSQTASRDGDWTVHARCAIGDFDGRAALNVAGNSVSSSILPMTAAHSQAEPSSAYIATEDVAMCRLDSVAGEYLAGGARTLLKIDTQGSEWQVLDGAQAVLPRITGILVEVSLLELYTGERLWKELSERIEAAGFIMWTLAPQFNDAHNGRTRQCDIAYFRTDA